MKTPLDNRNAILETLRRRFATDVGMIQFMHAPYDGTCRNQTEDPAEVDKFLQDLALAIAEAL